MSVSSPGLLSAEVIAAQAGHSNVAGNAIVCLRTDNGKSFDYVRLGLIGTVSRYGERIFFERIFFFFFLFLLEEGYKTRILY